MSRSLFATRRRRIYPSPAASGATTEALARHPGLRTKHSLVSLRRRPISSRWTMTPGPTVPGTGGPTTEALDLSRQARRTSKSQRVGSLRSPSFGGKSLIVAMVDDLLDGGIAFPLSGVCATDRARGGDQPAPGCRPFPSSRTPSLIDGTRPAGAPGNAQPLSPNPLPHHGSLADLLWRSTSWEAAGTCSLRSSSSRYLRGSGAMGEIPSVDHAGVGAAGRLDWERSGIHAQE